MGSDNAVNILVPVYNNSATLTALVDQVGQALGTAGYVPAFVFVNDASTDQSGPVLQQIMANNPAVMVIDHVTNRGQQEALRTGLAACAESLVVVMDADLQDRPDAIPALLRTLELNLADVVFAARVGRYQSGSRMMSSWIFRWLVRRVTGLPRGAGGFVAMRGSVADRIAAARSRRFYLAGLIGCSDARISAIPVARDTREFGQSGYTHSLRLRTAISNLICIFEQRVFFQGG